MRYAWYPAASVALIVLPFLEAQSLFQCTVCDNDGLSNYQGLEYSSLIQHPKVQYVCVW